MVKTRSCKVVLSPLSESEIAKQTKKVRFEESENVSMERRSRKGQFEAEDFERREKSESREVNKYSFRRDDDEWEYRRRRHASRSRSRGRRYSSSESDGYDGVRDNAYGRRSRSRNRRYDDFMYPFPYFNQPYGFGGYHHPIGFENHRHPMSFGFEYDRYRNVSGCFSGGECHVAKANMTAELPIVTAPAPAPAKRNQRSRSVSAATPPNEKYCDETPIETPKPRARARSNASPSCNSSADVLPAPGRRNQRARSVNVADAPPAKSRRINTPSETPKRGRPKLNASLDTTVDEFHAPTTRSQHSRLAAARANRITTVQAGANNQGRSNVPWLPVLPRFSVLDNVHTSRNHTIVSGALNDSNTPTSVVEVTDADGANNAVDLSLAKAVHSIGNNLVDLNASIPHDLSHDMMQAQIKLNAEMMQRVEALEAQRKAFEEERKKLQQAAEKNKKAKEYYKSLYVETAGSLEQLKKKNGNKMIKGKSENGSHPSDANKAVSTPNALNANENDLAADASNANKENITPPQVE
ncbi:uncharacterized protein LOC129571163 [Sitodiplosis mosellana]|uniref:uncharacterized protein LOC129571163 n=1 Tax=Sitodiplosis mosellana TaxID=263140 RepID=UPI002444A8CA|nr:uncharacterized protein LOC129571163 [Sitodiplosis mosellana]